MPLHIASAAGINVPENTTVLIGPQGGVGDGYPLSFEKLTSVLAFYVVNDWHEACELSIELLQNGIGHTMSLHTENKNIVLGIQRRNRHPESWSTQEAAWVVPAEAPALSLPSH